VGYIHYDKGELDEAQERFTRYGAITRRLVNDDPNDSGMVMELASTFTNLGALERARTNPDTDKALRLTQSALQYNQIALVLDPGNDVYRTNLADTLAFLADAWKDTCDLGKAIGFRQQNVDLSRELYAGSPDSNVLKLYLATSLSGLADVQRRIPIPEQALMNLQESHDLLSQLAEQDNENPVLRWKALMRDHWMMNIRFWTEQPETLWPEISAQKQKLDTFFLKEDLEEFKMSAQYADSLIDYSLFAWQADRREEADRILDEATDRLSNLVSRNPENRQSRRLLASALFEHWARRGMLPANEAAATLKNYLVNPERVTSCDDASLAARLELMRGNIFLAKDYTSYLLGKGFFEPGFVAFCKRYELCDQ
jgi:tetratricopeptide (TPR) repeat protein